MSPRTENVFTMLFTIVLVLGLYYMSGSMHSLWGLVLLLNMNS
jgi:hypothetical protein